MRENLEAGAEERKGLWARIRPWLGVGLALLSLGGFAPWIVEDTIQGVSFGVKTALEAGSPVLAAKGVERMRKMVRVGKILTIFPGALNPFTMPAYWSYFWGGAQVTVDAYAAACAAAEHPAYAVKVIEPSQAKEHVGEVVKMKVTCGDSHLFPKWGFVDAEGIRLVAFPSSYLYYKLETLAGRTIWVKGKLQEYKGALEIVLEDPKQIEEVEYAKD